MRGAIAGAIKKKRGLDVVSDKRGEERFYLIGQSRKAWRLRFRDEPPAFRTQDLLLRALIYRLEQRRHGGLSTALKRRLDELDLAYLADPEFQPAPPERLELGTQLTRTWNGTTHIVDVTEAGFVYRDGHAERRRALERACRAHGAIVASSDPSGDDRFSMSSSKCEGGQYTRQSAP